MLILLAVVVLPYWIYIPVLFILFIVFEFYLEGILVAFLIDVLYGAGETVGLSSYPFAIGALIFIIILLPLRSKLRLHA